MLVSTFSNFGEIWLLAPGLLFRTSLMFDASISMSIFLRYLVPGPRLSAPEYAPRRLSFLNKCLMPYAAIAISRFRRDLAHGSRLSLPHPEFNVASIWAVSPTRNRRQGGRHTTTTCKHQHANTLSDVRTHFEPQRNTQTDKRADIMLADSALVNCCPCDA